jgi:hypothetical protein
MKRNLKLVLWLMTVGAFAVQATDIFAQSSVPYTSASLFIWTNKYVYLPGEPITVRLTARGNNDLSLYTAVVYLQNNQTGAKTYLSGAGTSATAVDISGRTPGQGFTQYILGDVTKMVIVGSGGWIPGQVAPADLGMHTVALEIRDSAGSRILKTAYAKIGVVNGFTNLQGEITADQTLVNTRAYNLSGIVTVKNNATLTIQPGTFIFGQPGSQPPSALIIGVNGKIIAQGTRSRPITMTSSQAIGQRAPGDWGGLVMLGKAPLNVAGGVANIEGLPPSPDTTYGGNDSSHNCGTLAYVRVEFGGAILSPNNEINNITWGACGSGTVADHIQARYGLDDLFEWFGGTVDAKYLAGQNSRDDYLDGQLGWSGRLQHGVMLAGTDVHGNRGIEMDNSEFDDRAAPLGRPQIYNVSFVGSGDLFTAGFDETDSSAIYLRRGAGGAYNNLMLYNWIVNGFSARDNSGSTATRDSMANRTLTVNGLMMYDNGKASGRINDLNSTNGQAADFGSTGNANARNLLNGSLGDGQNVLIADPLLRRPLYRSDPDFLPLAGSPVFRANWVQPPDDGFFDQWARWNGGFGDVDWTEEWTVWPQEGDLRLD